MNCGQRSHLSQVTQLVSGGPPPETTLFLWCMAPGKFWRFCCVVNWEEGKGSSRSPDGLVTFLSPQWPCLRMAQSWVGMRLKEATGPGPGYGCSHHHSSWVTVRTGTKPHPLPHSRFRALSLGYRLPWPHRRWPLISNIRDAQWDMGARPDDHWISPLKLIHYLMHWSLVTKHFLFFRYPAKHFPPDIIYLVYKCVPDAAYTVENKTDKAFTV